jgi:hypothetical protein
MVVAVKDLCFPCLRVRSIPRVRNAFEELSGGAVEELAATFGCFQVAPTCSFFIGQCDRVAMQSEFPGNISKFYFAALLSCGRGVIE